MTFADESLRWLSWDVFIKFGGKHGEVCLTLFSGPRGRLSFGFVLTVSSLPVSWKLREILASAFGVTRWQRIAYRLKGRTHLMA